MTLINDLPDELFVQCISFLEPSILNISRLLCHDMKKCIMDNKCFSFYARCIINSYGYTIFQHPKSVSFQKDNNCFSVSSNFNSITYKEWIKHLLHLKRSNVD